jgi:hypothetical protein
LARPFEVPVGNDADLNGTTSAAGDFFGIALEYGVGAATDGADAKQSNVDGFHRAVREGG